MKVIIEGLAIECRDEGQGPVLVLLHGWMGSLHDFDAITTMLSAKYRIIRIDLPGFGESQLPHKPWHVGDYATFVSRACAKLGVQPYAFIGHSLGGRILLKGLAERTLSSQKVVLIASAGLAERQTLRNWSFKMIAKAGRAATAVPPFTLLRAKLRSKLYSAAQSDYANAGAMAQTFLNVISENLAPIAPLITVPTLLIWGSDDTTTPLAEGQRLNSLVHDSKLVVIPHAGHFVQKEKPEEVAEAIRTFL